MLTTVHTYMATAASIQDYRINTLSSIIKCSLAGQTLSSLQEGKAGGIVLQVDRANHSIL